MAATLPDLETVSLRRGASNGAELRIVLNRPERMNAWDKQLGLDLLAAVELAAADDSVRAVTITGAGRAFSSGADLRAGFDPRPGDGRPDVGTALRERYHPIITGIRRMPKPVLAAVNGPAVGIGCSLGPARAGAGRAATMAMLGERVPAAQASAWGLVDVLASDETFGEEVDRLAERLATGPTRAYAAAKQQLNARVYAGLDEQLELEARLQEEMAGSGDFAEGVMAFLEKRDARFSGE